MASQEVDRTEPGAACAGDAPGSQGGAAGEDSSAYRPLGRSQNHPEVLQVLGVSQPQVTHFCKVEGDNYRTGNLGYVSVGISELLIAGSTMCFKGRRGHPLNLRSGNAEA